MLTFNVINSFKVFFDDIRCTVHLELFPRLNDSLVIYLENTELLTMSLARIFFIYIGIATNQQNGYFMNSIVVFPNCASHGFNVYENNL